MMLILIFAVILGVIAADQVTKFVAVACLDGKPDVEVIPGFFDFSLLRNPGAAFGMLSEHRWIFMVVSSVAIVGLLVYLIRKPPQSKLTAVSLAMIIGGGIGNMIDRIFLGSVVDFLDFTLYYPAIRTSPFRLEMATYDFAVFNVADSFVCVGAALLMLDLILMTVKEAKEEKRKKAEADKPDGEQEQHHEE